MTEREPGVIISVAVACHVLIRKACDDSACRLPESNVFQARGAGCTTMWDWLPKFRSKTERKVTARWLTPSQNPWGLVVLDCSYIAHTAMSFTPSREIAYKYAELRSSTGMELRNEIFNPTSSTVCNLTYKVDKRPQDGPVFKSRVMEERWDIYCYDDRLYFCRSWGGELFYRATIKCDLATLSVLNVETGPRSKGDIAVRDVDFLVKSHLMLAKALHPLPPAMGKDIQKLALWSHSAYGRMGLYGTMEETIGTPYFWEKHRSS